MGRMASKPEHYHTRERQKVWDSVVPVIYTSADSPRSVVIPIDWSNFCVWGSAPTFARVGELLPFGFRDTVRFRAGPRIRHVEDAGGCWIVQAELELPNDSAA